MNPQFLVFPASNKEFFLTEEDEPLSKGDWLCIDGMYYFVLGTVNKMARKIDPGPNTFFYQKKLVYLQKSMPGFVMEWMER